jgi:hypothetical protein
VTWSAWQWVLTQNLRCTPNSRISAKSRSTCDAGCKVPVLRICGQGSRVEGLGSRAWGLEFGIQGLGLGFRAWGSGFRVQGSGFGA